MTRCNQSQDIIWGIGPQGYKCSMCGFDVYKRNVNKVDESCLGPLDTPGQDGGGDRSSKGVGKLITKISQISQSDLPFRKPSTPGEAKGKKRDKTFLRYVNEGRKRKQPSHSPQTALLQNCQGHRMPFSILFVPSNNSSLSSSLPRLLC